MRRLNVLRTWKFFGSVLFLEFLLVYFHSFFISVSHLYTSYIGTNILIYVSNYRCISCHLCDFKNLLLAFLEPN